MHFGRTTFLGLAIAVAGLSGAIADTRIDLSTSGEGVRKWTVRENTSGRVSAPAVVNQAFNWGNVPAISIPFTDCDGYWVARRTFQIPAGATNAVLTITNLGADDRAVVKLNGVVIASVGTNANGKGEMQFKDPGKNKPYRFRFISGPARVTNTNNLLPGLNIINVIVNNTNKGINGNIVPVSAGSPSEFGMTARVSYTP